MFKKFVAAACASTMLIASPASASITLNFDGDSVSGFIGKGDVQTAYGLNNARMQAAHTGMTFTYSDVVEYAVTCEWTTGPAKNPTVHTQTKNRSGGLTAALADSDRKTGQWTGWFVTGEVSGDSADIPEVGDPCPGEPGNDKHVVAVEELGSSGETLTVSHPTLGDRVLTYPSI